MKDKIPSHLSKLILPYFEGDEARALLWWRLSNPMLGDVSPKYLEKVNPGKLMTLLKEAHDQDADDE